MKISLKSKSSADTFELGKKLALQLTPGTVVILTGELGAGKTTFTQGIAAGLGIEKQVTSPTFVIAKNYETKSGHSFIHIDAYRLGDISDIADLDLDTQIDTGIVVAEWGEGFLENLGTTINVKLDILDDTTRLITITSDAINGESLEL